MSENAAAWKPRDRVRLNPDGNPRRERIGTIESVDEGGVHVVFDNPYMTRSGEVVQRCYATHGELRHA